MYLQVLPEPVETKATMMFTTTDRGTSMAHILRGACGYQYCFKERQSLGGEHGQGE